MSSQRAYKKELLDHLGRFFQDTVEWDLEMLPGEIALHIRNPIPFLVQLQDEGYIKLNDTTRLKFTLLKPPPDSKTYKL